MRLRAATLNHFLPVVLGSALAVAVAVARRVGRSPNAAWISAMADSIRLRSNS